MRPQTVISPAIEARLLKVYEETAAGITPFSAFNAYSHHGLAQRYAPVRQELGLTTQQLQQLNSRNLVAAYRSGYSLEGLGDTISERLNQESDEKVRFELCLAAYYALPTLECAAIYETLDPNSFIHIRHRDALASIRFYQHLLLHHATDVNALLNWRISDVLHDFLRCLSAAEMLEADPSAFFSTLAKSAAKLPEPILPPLEPATRLVSLAEFRSFADQPRQNFVPSPVFLSDNHRPATGEAVILVNANRPYFRRYADRFLASCGRARPGQIVHLNLVNGELSQEEIEALAKRHPIRLNVSREKFRGAEHVRRAYSAISRYIHLPVWLARYPLLAISDIDGEIVDSGIALTAPPKGAVALYSPPHQGADHPTMVWKNYHAGRALFHAPPTPVVRAVVGYCVHMFRRGIAEDLKLWHLDQLALALMVRAYPDVPVSPAAEFFKQEKST